MHNSAGPSSADVASGGTGQLGWLDLSSSRLLQTASLLARLLSLVVLPGTPVLNRRPG